MQNVQQTIISQYANDTVMTALIGQINAAFDPATLITSWYNMMWNVDTAQGYGLDCWGRIVGVSRVLQLPVPTAFFGFSNSSGGASGVGFGQAPFYDGSVSTSNYALSDNAFRTLIYAKALLNISNNSIPAINNILMTLFGTSGICYCTDGQNMTMTYTFTFPLTAVQQAIITQSGVLPRPCGVAASVGSAAAPSGPPSRSFSSAFTPAFT